MKVKRIIRKISEGNKKRNLFIPFPFLKRGPAIYYPYLDFQQLSYEEWIEKADVQELIELRRSFKWSKITKQRILIVVLSCLLISSFAFAEWKMGGKSGTEPDGLSRNYPIL